MVDVSHPLGDQGRFRAGAAVSGLWAAFVDRAGRRDAELSNVTIAVLFLAVLAVVSVPIALHPWPPLTDYINHLARMHVISTVGTDPDLARFYEIDWQIIPNLMMDLTVPTIQRFTNLFVAGQIYTIASLALILTGMLALHRELFGRISLLPLIAAPLLYNQVFLVGTMNYVSAIGVALWSLAAWIHLRERTMILRLAVSAVCVIALFFCHLYAAGVYGIGLLAYELCRLFRLPGCVPQGPQRGWGWRLFDFVATGLPFLPVLPLLMISPTWGLRTEYLWEWEGKLDGALFVIELYFATIAGVVAAIVAIAAALAMYARLLKFHAFGWMLLAVGTIVYLALPRIAFDTYMADQRLPISLAFLVIAGAQLDFRHRFARWAFATILVGVLALRISEVQAKWNETARTTDAFRASVQLIDRGSKVLVAYADPDADEELLNQGLVHAACLAIIERSSLVTTAFTVVGKHILRARADYRDLVDTEDGTPPSVSQLMEVAANPDMEADAYWGDWTADYDYVYFLFTGSDHQNPNPTYLDAKYVGNGFALYRIKPPDRSTPEPAEQQPQLSDSVPSQVAQAAPRIARVGPRVRHGNILPKLHNRVN